MECVSIGSVADDSCHRYHLEQAGPTCIAPNYWVSLLIRRCPT